MVAAARMRAGLPPTKASCRAEGRAAGSAGTSAGLGGARAQAAYLYYRGMGPKRSLAKMAAVYEPWRGTAAARQRAFERWSSRHGWVAKAKAWDRQQVEQEEVRQRELQERIDEDLATAMNNLWRTALDWVTEQIALDRADQQAHSRVYQEWLEQDAATRGELPELPKPRLTPTAIFRFIRIGLEYERIARTAAVNEAVVGEVGAKLRSARAGV